LKRRPGWYKQYNQQLKPQAHADTPRKRGRAQKRIATSNSHLATSVTKQLSDSPATVVE